VENLHVDADIIKWMALLPISLLLYNLNLIRKIKFPDKDKQAILQQWEGYLKLKITINTALIYSILFSFSAIFVWIGPSIFNKETQFLVLISSSFGSAFVVLSCYLAESSINEILLNPKI
jgi:hypothetical protein